MISLPSSSAVLLFFSSLLFFLFLSLSSLRWMVLFVVSLLHCFYIDYHHLIIIPIHYYQHLTPPPAHFLISVTSLPRVGQLKWSNPRPLPLRFVSQHAITVFL